LFAKTPAEVGIRIVAFLGDSQFLAGEERTDIALEPIALVDGPERFGALSPDDGIFAVLDQVFQGLDQS
jgi:hypothetical protein